MPIWIFQCPKCRIDVSVDTDNVEFVWHEWSDWMKITCPDCGWTWYECV